MTDRPSNGQLLWRAVTGARLDGLPIPAGGAWPRHRRALWRLGPPTVLVSAAVEYGAHPAATDTSLGVLAAVGAVRGGRAARRAWRMRRFRATYTRPTLAALKPVLGDAPVRLRVDPGLGTLMTRLAKPMSPAEIWVRTWYGQRVEPVVRWLPDRMQRARWAAARAAHPATRHLEHFRRPTTDAGQRIELRAATPYLTPEQRHQVEAIIGAKLPAGELIGSWDLVGPQATATWTVRKRPPTHVGYADLDARFGQLGKSEFFLGLGVGGKPVVVDLHGDSPHFAVSAGSGAGKSVLAQLVAVQVLARGGQVTILDIKGSHRWALNMPGVDYCHTPEQMHRALLRLSALADERNQASLYESDDWDPGPRHLVIAEELNATMGRIRDWWEAERPKGSPKIPPAVSAFRSMSAMGRSALVNEVAIAQMLSANAAGGPEARENFGIRCLARYTANNWKMLCPNTGMPRPSRTLGRWQIVVGDSATETQVCFLTTSQARLFVAKNRAGVHMPAVTLDGPLASNVHVDGPGHVDMPPAMTLQDSIDEGLHPLTLATLQKRLQRARAAGGPTPPPVGKRQRADLYERAALIAWLESELIP